MAYHLNKRNQGKFSLATASGIGMLRWIAEQKGFFHDEKLQIKFSTVPYSRKAMEMMIGGELDCGMLAEINIAYLGYIKPSIPIKCLASVEKRTADSLLALGTDLVPSDMEGKCIGFMPRTSSHSFLMKFLEHHKIERKNIKLKPLSPQVMGDALIRGDVDAISCWHPHIHNTIYAMKELGKPYTHFLNTGFYASESVLAISKPFLVKNRKSVIGMIKALRKAEIYIQQNRQEATVLLGQKFKMAGPEHGYMWDLYDPALRPIDAQYMGNILLLADWITKNDTEYKGQPIPDYSDCIDQDVFLTFSGA